MVKFSWPWEFLQKKMLTEVTELRLKMASSKIKKPQAEQ